MNSRSPILKCAYLKKVRLFFRLRADACRFGIGEADCLFVLPDGTQEASAARPLVNHRRPRPFPPWESTLPQVQPPFCSGSVVQWGITPHPFLITGASSASGSQGRTRYAQRRGCSFPRQTFTSKGAAVRVSPFDSVEARNVQRTDRAALHVVSLPLRGRCPAASEEDDGRKGRRSTVSPG